MKAEIKYIGIIDYNRQIHHIEFKSGVNIITGKSSTGKSAILEVFDYCFGSSEFNIPDGVLTQNAILYFVVLCLEEAYLVLGRGEHKNIHYITTETDENLVMDYNNFNYEYFSNLDKINSTDFNKELNKYFKLDIEDTDEDLEDRKYRKNNAKKGAPSFRHFSSFILQHQNLIANKHALFYRFDEKEKKDQTIEQFKIFLSIVDAEYFVLKQKLAEYQREKKQIEFLKEKALKLRESFRMSLVDLLKEFQLKTNKRLFSEDVDEVISKPTKFLRLLDDFEINLNEVPNIDIVQRNELQKRYNNIMADIRKAQNTISNIDVSIAYAKDFANQKSNISHVKGASSVHDGCVFCGNTNENLFEEQNKLVGAINWFNSEMKKSSYTIQSFESDRKSYEAYITNLQAEARKLKRELSTYDKIIKELYNNKSIEEQARKVVLKIETFLESLQEQNTEDVQEDLKKIQEKISGVESRLREEYNTDQALELAMRQINQEINRIGSKLDFEKIYKQSLNLKFDIETFELYQQNTAQGKPTNRVYLRSMGSGANWLYSHISLFTGLLYHFCALGRKALIPTILFIDQPSQVYFPSEIDKDEKFDAHKLKESSLKKGEDLERIVSEDLESVTNLYNQLIAFCNYTDDETGIKPQIIITDHADNLKLQDVTFESLVRARWRKEGEGLIQGV